VGQELLGEPVSRLEVPDHVLFLQDDDGARRHGRGRGHAVRLTGEAAFAEEMPGLQDGDHGLFAGV
jgi:hypothetical protein